MTYIGELDVYELHPGDEKKINDFADETRIFCYTYYKGWLLFKSIFVDILSLV